MWCRNRLLGCLQEHHALWRRKSGRTGPLLFAPPPALFADLAPLELLGRRFVVIVFVLAVELHSIVDVFEERQFPLADDDSRLTELKKIAHPVRGQNEPRGPQPLQHHFLCHLAEFLVSAGADFVEKVVVEIHRHVDGEGYALLHAGGVLTHRLVEVFADVRSLADILDHVIDLVAVQAIDAAGKARVLGGRHRPLKPRC